MNVRCHKIDSTKIRSNFLSFKVVKLRKLNNTDVTVLIGADFPKLRIQKDFRYASDEDPCAVKAELVSVLLGGKTSSVYVQSNKISTVVKTLFYQGFLSRTLTTHRTAGKGGDHLLLNSSTSTRSRIFRHFFVTLHVR